VFGDLPVQAPMMVLHLKTAKALGLRVRSSRRSW
jgi:hypothetical protein